MATPRTSLCARRSARTSSSRTSSTVRRCRAPNFVYYEKTSEIGGPLPENDDEAARVALGKLQIAAKPKEVYREGDDVEIRFDERTLHVNAATGHVLEEGRRARFFIRFANWLHLTRGKKAWNYVAHTYAAALLFLACSGMFI